MDVLDERSKKILWAIIQSHIDFNIPVGSFMVTKRFSFGLSPATIRNTMATLEALGYVTQPHTSAGRVPTESGYKLYVNTLLKERTLSINKALLQKLYNRLCNIEKDLYRLIKETSKALSIFSRYIGIATLPKTDDMILKHIRFIKYEKNKALSILISEEGIVKNRVFNLEEKYTQKQLDKIAYYLNSRFSGLTLRELREEIILQLDREKIACDKLIANALKICKDIVTYESDSFFTVGLSGTSNLPDFVTVRQVKEILKAIEDKHLMLKLLEQMAGSKGVKVFVGLDNIMPSMKELSMVVSTYSDRMHAHGTIGIIGPTRMNYKKLIPIVDHTAKTLTQILSEA